MSPQPGKRSEKWLLTVNMVLPAAGDMLQESGPMALSPEVPIPEGLGEGSVFYFSITAQDQRAQEQRGGHNCLLAAFH